MRLDIRTDSSPGFTSCTSASAPGRLPECGSCVEYDGAKGGLPWRYAPDGSVALASPSKESREFHGRPHVLEYGITTDFAFVWAWRGDLHGNKTDCRLVSDPRSREHGG